MRSVCFLHPSHPFKYRQMKRLLIAGMLLASHLTFARDYFKIMGKDQASVKSYIVKNYPDLKFSTKLGKSTLEYVGHDKVEETVNRTITVDFTFENGILTGVSESHSYPDFGSSPEVAQRAYGFAFSTLNNDEALTRAGVIPGNGGVIYTPKEGSTAEKCECNIVWLVKGVNGAVISYFKNKKLRNQLMGKAIGI